MEDIILGGTYSMFRLLESRLAQPAGFFNFGGKLFDAGDDAALFSNCWKWDGRGQKIFGPYCRIAGSTSCISIQLFFKIISNKY